MVRAFYKIVNIECVDMIVGVCVVAVSSFGSTQWDEFKILEILWFEITSKEKIRINILKVVFLFPSKCIHKRAQCGFISPFYLILDKCDRYCNWSWKRLFFKLDFYALNRFSSIQSWFVQFLSEWDCFYCGKRKSQFYLYNTTCFLMHSQTDTSIAIEFYDRDWFSYEIDHDTSI